MKTWVPLFSLITPTVNIWHNKTHLNKFPWGQVRLISPQGVSHKGRNRRRSPHQSLVRRQMISGLSEARSYEDAIHHAALQRFGFYRKPTEHWERFCCQELPPVFVAQDSANDENCQSEEVKIDENVNPPSLDPNALYWAMTTVTGQAPSSPLRFAAAKQPEGKLWSSSTSEEPSPSSCSRAVVLFSSISKEAGSLDLPSCSLDIEASPRALVLAPHTTPEAISGGACPPLLKPSSSVHYWAASRHGGRATCPGKPSRRGTRLTMACWANEVWCPTLARKPQRKADILSFVSKDTEFCIKPCWYQTSTYGSTDFRDHWYWWSDSFDTGAAWYKSQCLLKPRKIPSKEKASSQYKEDWSRQIETQFRKGPQHYVRPSLTESVGKLLFPRKRPTASGEHARKHEAPRGATRVVHWPWAPGQPWRCVRLIRVNWQRARCRPTPCSLESKRGCCSVYPMALRPRSLFTPWALQVFSRRWVAVACLFLVLLGFGRCATLEDYYTGETTTRAMWRTTEMAQEHATLNGWKLPSGPWVSWLLRTAFPASSVTPDPSIDLVGRSGPDVREHLPGGVSPAIASSEIQTAQSGRSQYLHRPSHTDLFSGKMGFVEVPSTCNLYWGLLERVLLCEQCSGFHGCSQHLC